MISKATIGARLLDSVSAEGGSRGETGTGWGRQQICRVLLISHVADSRHPNGGTVYTRSLLQVLEDAFPGVETEAVFFTGQLPRWRKRVRQAAAVLRAALSVLPSKVHYFRSSRFASELRRRMDCGRYDLVILDHAEMLWCLDLIPMHIRALAVAHNIESHIFEQLVGDRVSIPLLGRLFRSDIQKFRRFELDSLARVGRVLAISTEDAALLRAQAPGLQVLAVPPTFRYRPAERCPRSCTPLRIGLLGNFEWWPNRDAYDWFRERVWPLVGGDLELHVFGIGSGRLPGASRIHRHGWVDELAAVWCAVDLMINPIVSGSGVNIKVAEAIYNGMPMLCTSRAVAGMSLQVDPAIVVIDDAAEWARFLGGESVYELARQRPAPSTRGQFHADGQVPRLRSFLDGTPDRSGQCCEAAESVLEGKVA